MPFAQLKLMVVQKRSNNTLDDSLFVNGIVYMKSIIWIIKNMKKLLNSRHSLSLVERRSNV